jgi:peptide/nickel transport system substrate-binding protein
LDKDRVVAEVLRGSGYTASLPWPKYSLAFDEASNNTYRRDVDKAKQLIAEVGTIPTLPLTYNPTPIQEALAAIVQSNLGEIGIPIELDPVDGAQFVKELIGAQFKGLWIATHSWAQYTPSTLTVSAYPFNAHKNASRYESRDYISAADSAWETADGGSAEAVAAYQEVSEHLLDAAFLAEIAIYWEQWATAAKLQGAGYTKRSELLLTDAWLA